MLCFLKLDRIVTRKKRALLANRWVARWFSEGRVLSCLEKPSFQAANRFYCNHPGDNKEACCERSLEHQNSSPQRKSVLVLVGLVLPGSNAVPRFRLLSRLCSPNGLPGCWDDAPRKRRHLHMVQCQRRLFSGYREHSRRTQHFLRPGFLPEFRASHQSANQRRNNLRHTVDPGAWPMANSPPIYVCGGALSPSQLAGSHAQNKWAGSIHAQWNYAWHDQRCPKLVRLIQLDFDQHERGHQQQPYGR